MEEKSTIKETKSFYQKKKKKGTKRLLQKKDLECCWNRNFPQLREELEKQKLQYR